MASFQSANDGSPEEPEGRLPLVQIPTGTSDEVVGERLEDPLVALTVEVEVAPHLTIGDRVEKAERPAVRSLTGDLEGAEPFLLSELAYQTRDLEDRLAFIAKYRREGSKPWQRDMWIHDQRSKVRANNRRRKSNASQ